MTRPAEPTAARLRIRSFCAAWSSLMANATVSRSSPSASQLMVSGDSRTFTQVMVRSRPPAPASTSPRLNPPSAIASRTVSAMGVTSMPQSRAGVKDQRNQSLLDGLHNAGVRLGLLAFRIESTGVDGDSLTPGAGRLKQSGGRGRKQGGTAGGQSLSSLQQRKAFDQASCKEVPNGQLHNRDSRRAAPRDPGAPPPDRRGQHLPGGPHRRRRRAASAGPSVRARARGNRSYQPHVQRVRGVRSMSTEMIDRVEQELTPFGPAPMERTSGNFWLIETLRRWGITAYAGVNGCGLIHVAKHLEPLSDPSQLGDALPP